MGQKDSRWGVCYSPFNLQPLGVVKVVRSDSVGYSLSEGERMRRFWVPKCVVWPCDSIFEAMEIYLGGGGELNRSDLTEELVDRFVEAQEEICKK